MEEEIHQLKNWYYSRPLVTRTYLSICVVFTLLISCGLISPFHIFYTFQQTFLELNIWRPFTALFFMGKLDIDFLFSFYLAYHALIMVETKVFPRDKYADFLWLIVLLFLGCIIFGSVLDLYFFTDPFLMGIVYIWGKWLPHQQLQLLGLIKIKTGWFPYIYACYMIIMEHRIAPYVVGIFLGHCYFFIKVSCLYKYNKDYLATPQWFSNWWHGRNAGRDPPDGLFLNPPPHHV